MGQRGKEALEFQWDPRDSNSIEKGAGGIVVSKEGKATRTLSPKYNLEDSRGGKGLENLNILAHTRQRSGIPVPQSNDPSFEGWTQVGRRGKPSRLAHSRLSITIRDQQRGGTSSSEPVARAPQAGFQ